MKVSDCYPIFYSEDIEAGVKHFTEDLGNVTRNYLSSADLDRSSNTFTQVDVDNVQRYLWDALNQYESLHPNEINKLELYQTLGQQFLNYINEYKPQVVAR